MGVRGVSHTRYRAVGIPWRAMKAFAKTLLHSSCAAARDGPKISRPRGREEIDDAAIERQLGTDDGEVDALALGKREHGFDIGGVDGDAGRDVAHAGIARRADHRFDGRLRGQFPGQRVLAAAAADDHEPHCLGVWSDKPRCFSVLRSECGKGDTAQICGEHLGFIAQNVRHL